MKQNFIVIVSLMGVSLLGIFLIQWFWMQKAISITEEQFDQAVNEALSRSAHRIERNQNAFFISSMFSGFGGNPTFQNNTKNGTVQATDSIILDFKDYWNEEDQEIKPKRDPEKNISIEKYKINGIQTITYGFDTIIVDGNKKQHIQTYSSISAPDSSLFDMKITPTFNAKESEFEVMRDQLSDVMDQMVLEFTTRNIPIEERLSRSVVVPTLEYELKNMNIPLKFEYAISDGSGHPIKKLKSNGFSKEKLNTAYKSQLFPNDIIRSPELLHLYFPEKRAYIFKSLNILLIGSLIFTIIILITFYYTLRTLFNQKKVSEIKTDFINNMTHEFKTPIATISLAADTISNPIVINDKEKVQRFTNIIKEENRRMNRQVESVLQMSLLDTKDLNLVLVDMDIHPLISKAINNISIQIEQKGGSITFVPNAKKTAVNIDETHFVNIIYNLLDNANKYTVDKSPEIIVETLNTDNYIQLTIKDNGIGMDKETQEKIFDKFYRYSTGNIHTIKGFGLGLSYVKIIVLALKGSISVKSNKGKGSIFTIIFPVK